MSAPPAAGVAREDHARGSVRIGERLSAKLAEGMRFELTVRFYPYNGLANRRLQPLGHPSAERIGFAHTAYARLV